jgi:hypothetical protein
MTAATTPLPQTGAHRATVVRPGATGGLVSPSTGNIRLAAEHFAAATIYLLAGAIGLVWIAPELAAGNFLSPHVAGVTHLFTLGWLTTTIFGALYQLLPVALGAPIRWRWVGHASFWTFAPGAGVFACGVAESSTLLHHTGIALIGTGVTLGVANIGATLPRAKSRDVTWAAIALAVTFLSTTLVLGIVLLHNIHTGFIAEARLRVLATHLHVAIVGWALVMIVGVSHRLLPMFLLAHGADTRWTKRAVVLLAAGLVLLAAGINTSFAAAAWLGALSMGCGLGCFHYQATRFYKARIRKRVDVGMQFAGVALGFQAVAAVLGFLVLWLGASATRFATSYVLVGLLGGIVIYVSGFFYKIVPLLAWTARFSGKMSTPNAPTVADLFSARVAKVQLALMAGGVVTLAASILGGWTLVAHAGACAFLIGALLFVSQIGRIAFGRRAGAPS